MDNVSLELNVSIELAKCPFCGGEDTKPLDSQYGWAIYCENCEIYGPRGLGKAEAAYWWNRRGAEPAQDQILADRTSKKTLEVEEASVQCKTPVEL